jgi:hypothetical protein
VAIFDSLFVTGREIVLVGTVCAPTWIEQHATADV